MPAYDSINFSAQKFWIMFLNLGIRGPARYRVN